MEYNATVTNLEEPVQIRPKPTDFDKYLPWACTQLCVESVIVVNRTYLSEYVSTVTSDSPKKKSKKPKIPYTETNSETSEVRTDPHAFEGLAIDNKVYLDAVYDNNFELVQLHFFKNNTNIPRLVFKIIGLLIPFHKHLTSITINSGLNPETIYEISKFLSVSQITDLCFDHTYLIKANYHILLDQGALKILSLCKCNINDNVVELIAQKLVDPYPAAKTLRVLNLATNKITDAGIKHLADMLRTNRHLCYLNLADNLITDKGAISLLDILVEFPLNSEETKNKNARHIIYLKEKIDLVVETAKELRAGELEKKVTKKKTPRSTSSQREMKKGKLGKENSGQVNLNTSLLAADAAIKRAEAIVKEKIGLFSDPFDLDNTILRNDVLYCYGNNTLCYLNISYNDLTYSSLKKLHEVVLFQKLKWRKPKGLVNVRIDGNYLPEYCIELAEIDEILESGIQSMMLIAGVKKRAFSKHIPSRKNSRH